MIVKAFYKRKLDEGCAKAVKAQKAKDDVKRIMEKDFRYNFAWSDPV